MECGFLNFWKKILYLTQFSNFSFFFFFLKEKKCVISYYLMEYEVKYLEWNS